MLHVSLQILSNNAVNTGVGVYWMFYAAGDFEEVAVPAGIPGIDSGQSVEGLRCVTCKHRLPLLTLHSHMHDAIAHLECTSYD